VGRAIVYSVRKVPLLIWCCLLTASLGHVPFGQSPKGTIPGTVVDPTSAAVSGAAITLTTLATTQTQTATTDDAGRYILNLIPRGTYSETVAANGFQTAKQNNIISDISVHTPVDFKLGVGQVSSQVEVVTTTPPLETSWSNVDTVIT
jgi:hypothetical protein